MQRTEDSGRSAADAVAAAATAVERRGASGKWWGDREVEKEGKQTVAVEGGQPRKRLVAVKPVSGEKGGREKRKEITTRKS